MTDLQDVISDFLVRGYAKLTYERRFEIDTLSSYLVEKTNNYLQKQGLGEHIDSLDKLHLCVNDKSLNDLRMYLITSLNERKNTNNLLIDSAISSHIENILGNDLLIQKHVNLVLQRPEDPDISETHRDFPGNSAFELVVWVPLVDCDEKMSLYLIDKELSLFYTNHLRKTKGRDWSRIKKEIETKATTVPVRYGEVLIFMTPLFHGSRVNKSESTRVSLNFRMKSLFSPAGLKDSYAFWNMYSLSQFTKSCIDFI